MKTTLTLKAKSIKKGRFYHTFSSTNRPYKIPWPTQQDEGDTKNDQFNPNKTKAIQGKNTKNADVNETQYTFKIINTETEYYKYTLSKRLEELDESKRYKGKSLYYIKQIIFLFYRNNKVIVPLKLFAKKKIK